MMQIQHALMNHVKSILDSKSVHYYSPVDVFSDPPARCRYSNMISIPHYQSGHGSQGFIELGEDSIIFKKTGSDAVIIEYANPCLLDVLERVISWVQSPANMVWRLSNKQKV